MGDAADILGINKKQGKVETIESALSSTTTKRKQRVNNKPPNISREVYALLNNGTNEANVVLPSIVPSHTNGFKDRRGGTAQKWEWVQYENSAREDKEQFYRWHKCGIEFMDYPYVRFNTKLDKIEYSEEEYDRYLSTNNPNRIDLFTKPASSLSMGSSSSSGGSGGFIERKWSQEEDNELIRMAHLYDLRWPVIFDRWISSERKCEELQIRYSIIAQTIVKARSAENENPEKLEEKAIRLGVSLSHCYNLKEEMDRRNKVDQLFHKPEKLTNKESKTELEIRQELKMVDAELKKLRRDIAAKANTLKEAEAKETSLSSSSPSTQSSQAGRDLSVESSSKKSPFQVHENEDGTFPAFDASSLAGRPYLMSLRYKVPTEDELGKGKGMKKQLVSKMEDMLVELKVPARPLPTPMVCDAYDKLRKDIVTLLSLKKLSEKSGSESQALNAQLDELSNPTPSNVDSISSSSSSSLSSSSQGGNIGNKSVGEKSKRKGGTGSGNTKKRTKK